MNGLLPLRGTVGAMASDIGWDSAGNPILLRESRAESQGKAPVQSGGAAPQPVPIRSHGQKLPRFSQWLSNPHQLWAPALILLKAWMKQIRTFSNDR